MTSGKIPLELGDGIGREWNLAGLVKLGCAYMQYSFRRIVVLCFQSKEFTQAQTGTVQQNQSKTYRFAAEGSVTDTTEIERSVQETSDFNFAEDVGRAWHVLRRKQA